MLRAKIGLKRRIATGFVLALAVCETVCTIFPYQNWSGPSRPVFAVVDVVFHMAKRYSFFIPFKSSWDGQVAFYQITDSKGSAARFLQAEFAPGLGTTLTGLGVWLDSTSLSQEEFADRSRRFKNELLAKRPELLNSKLIRYEIAVPPPGQDENLKIEVKRTEDIVP